MPETNRCWPARIAGLRGNPDGGVPIAFRPAADATAQKLRDWWPSIADGDKEFVYTAEELGDAALAAYVNAFGDSPPADNDLSIELPRRSRA